MGVGNLYAIVVDLHKLTAYLRTFHSAKLQINLSKTMCTRVPFIPAFSLPIADRTRLISN